MRAPFYTHAACQIRSETIALLHHRLRPSDYSKRCSSWWVLSCLVLVAAAQLSLSAVATLRGEQSRETLRQALLATLPDYQQTLRQIPRLLRDSLPKGLRKRCRRGRKRRYPLAIDIHSVPYYKRKKAPPPAVRKGKPLPGTSYSHQYATATLLHKGRYYTVALIPYLPGDGMAALVKHLLQQATANGFAPWYVLLDRYFWSVDVFRYLQQAHYPFLMPMLARGKKATAPGGPTGTRVFLQGHASGWYVYQVTKHHRQKKTTVNIGVHRHNAGGERGRHGRWTWAYAVWRMPVSSVVHLHESYRRRFRIESSYRLLEAARGRTSSRNEGLRLWYVLVAVILVNRWLELRREQSRRSTVIEYWWNQLLVTLVFGLLLQTYEENSRVATADGPLRE